MAPSTTHPGLHATFTSPTTQQHFSHPLRTALPLPEVSSSTHNSAATETKTAYLRELRDSAKKLQDEINVFLTRKMGEEKAEAAAGVGAEGRNGAAEREVQREEERYGEDEEGDEDV